MAARRIACGLVLGLGVALAAPARAEDPAALTQPLDTQFIEGVADGIGSFLGKLVGPPISSPSPYLNTPGARPQDERQPAPAAVAAPLPVPEPPKAQEPPPPVQAVIVPPPAPPPPPAVPKSVSPPVPAAAPPPPPPPARPAVVQAAPARAEAPVAAVPAAATPCAARVAATATLEQLRRLPRCSP